MSQATLKSRLLNWMRGAGFLYECLRTAFRTGRWCFVWTARIILSGTRLGPPSGFFSVFGSLQSEGCFVRTVMNGQALSQLPDRSLIRDAGMNQNAHQPWPIFVASMSHVRLVGSSLCPMNDRKQLMKEACYGDSYYREDPSFHQFISRSCECLSGDWTSITGRFSNGYFHWMMDDLPRLAVLGLMPPETRIVVRGPLRKYQRESLQLLGIEDRVYPAGSRHLLVERFHFSSPLGMTGCSNPYAVSWLRNHFSEQFQAREGLPKKLFVIRRGKTRGVLNQDELAEKLAALDWVIIDLEDLPLDRQITVFANASHIVAEHGAALTNLLWCRPGTKVLELCADNFLNGCYEGIALCVGLDHRFEIFKADRANRIHVPLNGLLELLGEW